MIHTLRVARAETGSIIAAMSIFVSEPTLDWVKATRKSFETQSTAPDDCEHWWPEEVVRRAKRVLDGAHPTAITCYDLQKNKHVRGQVSKLTAMLRGEEDASATASVKRKHGGLWRRATFRSDGLTVEQQVSLEILESFTNRRQFLFCFAVCRLIA